MSAREHYDGKSLPLLNVERDALGDTEVFRTVVAEGLEPARVGPQAPVVVDRHLRPPPAFTMSVTRGSVPMGYAPSGGADRRPILRQSQAAGEDGVVLPTRGKSYNRLPLIASAWMWPSPRRYPTSASMLSVEVSGKAMAAPTGDAPLEPRATYGVTSTAFASCACARATGNARTMSVTASVRDLTTCMSNSHGN